MKRKRTIRAVDPLVKALLVELDQREMSITALSLRAGLGKSTIPAWVQGKRVPNVGNMRAALGVVGSMSLQWATLAMSGRCHQLILRL